MKRTANFNKQENGGGRFNIAAAFAAVLGAAMGSSTPKLQTQKSDVENAIVRADANR